MKRIFTLLLLTATVSMVSAQTPGYRKKAIYDDFASATPYADPNPADPNYPDGIYWWGKDALGNSSQPSNTDPCFAANKYAITRSGNGKMNLVVTQGSNCWMPMGISTKLDLSGNATFEVSVTNTSSIALYFDIALVDENKKFINCDANGDNYRVLSIAPNETKVFSGDFTGGQHKTWVNGTPTFSTGLDLLKVVEIDFTIVNADQPESNGWGPLAITDATFTFNYVKIGNVAGTGVSEISNKMISVYPNPSQDGMVTFSQQLTNVNVYNTMGQLLLSANSATKLDISTLSAGIYVLQSNEGQSKLVVE
ncbi:MAG: T9SS type A sorting domain-containing protein [Flavobacteriales bacterium]